MIDKNFLDGLIGKKQSVFTGPEDSLDVKDIIVKSWKQVGESFVIVSEDGEIFSEDEINYTYTVTPEAALWLSLIKAGILEEDLDTFDFEMYHNAFLFFMETLEKTGVVAKHDED